jgi:hypothetical protein
MSKKPEQTSEKDYVYYTHPDGRVEEMTRTEAAKLEKSQGGVVAGAPDEIITPGQPEK